MQAATWVVYWSFISNYTNCTQHHPAKDTGRIWPKAVAVCHCAWRLTPLTSMRWSRQLLSCTWPRRMVGSDEAGGLLLNALGGIRMQRLRRRRMGVRAGRGCVGNARKMHVQLNPCFIENVRS